MARARISLKGKLGDAGQEDWSISLNYRLTLAPDATEATEYVNEIRDAIDALWDTGLSDLKSLLSNRGDVRTVEGYFYADTGPAVSNAEAAFSTPQIGTSVASAPPQTAAVLSLLTDLPGPSRRGRVYWPALAPLMSGSLVSATAQAAADDMVALAVAIRGAMAQFTATDWVVYSPKLNELTDVSRVRAGNVLDTQRRRRDRLVESFTTTTVTL